MFHRRENSFNHVAEYRLVGAETPRRLHRFQRRQTSLKGGRVNAGRRGGGSRGACLRRVARSLCHADRGSAGCIRRTSRSSRSRLRKSRTRFFRASMSKAASEKVWPVDDAVSLRGVLAEQPRRVARRDDQRPVDWQQLEAVGGLWALRLSEHGTYYLLNSTPPTLSGGGPHSRSDYHRAARSTRLPDRLLSPQERALVQRLFHRVAYVLVTLQTRQLSALQRNGHTVRNTSAYTWSSCASLLVTRNFPV